MPIVAIVAQGEMGAGVARRLTENGVTVLTDVEGRSQASRRRAEAAGMHGVSWDEIGAADLFLSIVPPGRALSLASEAAARWRGAQRRPVYVDCNAVSPHTVETIADLITAAGGAFVDAAIIGSPPRPGDKGPRIYASGADASVLASLAPFGLDVRVLAGDIGAASTLKMSYAGMTKGMTALSAIMILGAARAGASEALKSELAASQPAHLDWLSRRQIPGMFSKASRWVAEMEEIAAFEHEDPPGAEIFHAVARFYMRIAASEGAENEEVAVLRDFIK